MAEEQRWLLIINPNAGKGKGKKDSKRIQDLLRKEGFEFSSRFTERKGDAIHYTVEGIAEGYRNIIVVGGDGTLNEAVNGVMLNKSCHKTDVTLAIIPVGTGNDWGRMFGISLNYERAIATIKERKTLLHDVGHIFYTEGTGRKERYFINIAGLGFQSAVVRRSNHQKDKGRGGKMIYFYSLLRTLFIYRNVKSEMYIDDGTLIESNVFSVNIGNGRYSGGGMRQTPDAIPDDGMFDLTVINDMGKIEIIRNLGLLYDGTILSHPKIDGYRCRRISITSKAPMYLDADGETLGHTPAEFSIIPAGIRIIYHTRITE
ncbi:MAG TPA: diacylglycerol kinase family protein [Bacteroidales bacterium]|nr:diacylglycerol kinase family protein [Bacteroidales bacterium]